MLTAAGVVAATLAGCTGGDGGGETGVRIEGADPDPPPELPVSPAVAVSHREATRERPAGVAVAWTNEGERPLRVGEERSVGFRIAASEDGRARLLAREGRDWGDVVSYDGCWYVAGDVYADGDYRTVRLEPGAAFESASGLYADGDCLEAGTYRFRTRVSTGAAGAAGGTDERGETAAWGFDLDVRRDG